MADESEGIQPDPEEAEGGPVKSFLEHLEDLRWTLIKATTTLAVAMLICLIGGNYLVRFLTFPLHLASREMPSQHAARWKAKALRGAWAWRW